MSRLTFGLHVCMSGEEQSNLARRSLVKGYQESEPALISVNFSFLLHLSEVQYHWSKSRKGEKTVNLLQYWSKGLQHYTRVKCVHYTHITRSVHTPYMQIHQNACYYMHVISRGRRDIACKITRSHSTGTH